eukprot:CAMPEP_0194365776 /NCGR_PEP_ID=MMETSP0174-20130528/13793_1 /TAXON_ID=216777 /ORGANISM="Proboscia alata, Strain PI-D3" /LENGTH=491 /DNA_ID=CAMNT_0039140617 /DNA_START=570 /DNA_END=2045 /DNA_ORIENTATION=-
MVENSVTKEILDPKDHEERFKLNFGGKPSDKCSNKTVDGGEPYYCVNLSIHQSLFDANDSFTLIVEANQELGQKSIKDDVTFGRSDIICVTDYAFEIEEHFDLNPHVVRLDKKTVAWYSKCGGDNSGLDVLIHIKDRDGEIVDSLHNEVPVKTELAYADGSATPFMPLAPLKERRSTKISKNPLYRALREDPIIVPGEGSQPFSFRIEEVSFHHSGQDGFKLKVLPADSNIDRIHPAILRENIIVLSKPKHDPSGKGKLPICDKLQTSDTVVYEGHNCSPSSNYSWPLMKKHFSQERKTARRVSIHDINDIDTIATMTARELSEGLLFNGGECHFCGQKTEPMNFFDSSMHKKSCRFIDEMLPFFKVISFDNKNLLERNKSKASKKKCKNKRQCYKKTNCLNNNNTSMHKQEFQKKKEPGRNTTLIPIISPIVTNRCSASLNFEDDSVYGLDAANDGRVMPELPISSSFDDEFDFTIDNLISNEQKIDKLS